MRPSCISLSLRPIKRPTPALFLTVLALAATCACRRSTPEARPSAAPPVSVQTVTLQRGSVARRVTLPSFRILAEQEATLFAKVPGYLKTITVDKGDAVERGQLLAELEVPELTAEELEHKAEAQVARTNFERMAEARQKAPDLVVPLTVDELRGKWEVAQAQLQRTQSLLQFARITAPFAGTITARFVDPGAFIPAATAGAAARSAAIVTLMDFSKVRVQVFVPETEVPFIHKDLPVRVTFEAVPEKTFQASVTRFSYALDSATKTMLTEIEIGNPQGQLRPGMYATVQFEMERKPDAWVLPVGAVSMERAGAFVFVVAEGKAKRLPIRSGFNDGANVEVTGGLEPGQPVVLLGKQPVTDGQPVVATGAK